MKKLFPFRIPLFSPATLLAVLSVAPTVQAECPCSRGHSSNTPIPAQMSYANPSSNSMSSYHTASPSYYAGNRSVMSTPAAPSGTLGMTYYRTTREIPASKPPRVGMVNIKVGNATTKVAVSNTYAFREEDEIKGHRIKDTQSEWIFETKPLVSGIPHIYKVEAQDESGAIQVKYFRMVPGRIVEIQF